MSEFYLFVMTRKSSKYSLKIKFEEYDGRHETP